MRRRFVHLLLVGLSTLAVSAGCSKGGERLEFTSRADDIKASLRLPLGWAVEGPAAEFFDREIPVAILE